MAAFNFPNSPSTNDLHTENSVTWKWDGVMWNRVGPAYTDTTNLNVTGIGTFAGDVHIAGVLTYEDVKNVDSVGVITARSNIYIKNTYPRLYLQDTDTNSDFSIINSNGAFMVYDDTNSANRFTINSSGVGAFNSDLEVAGSHYITDSIIHTGDTNTKIRFPAADTFTVETNNTERFRIGSNGYIGVGDFSSKSRTDPLNVDSGIGTCNIGGNYIHLKRYSGGNTQYITAPQNNANLYISADDHIVFGVDHSSSMYSHGTEAFRITSGGNIGIGTANPQDYDGGAESLVVCGPGNTLGQSGITIVSGSDKYGCLYFGDGTGSASYRGRVEYRHDVDLLQMGAGGAHGDFVLDANGDMYLRGDSTVYLVLGSAGDATTGGPTNNMNWVRGDSNDLLYNAIADHKWEVGGTEKMLLEADGDLKLQAKTQVRITLGSAGTHGSNDSNWIRGDSNNLMFNCSDTSGEHIFEVAGTATAKINPGKGVRAENTCKAWVCYKHDGGVSAIIDDFFVTSVTDENTGIFAIQFEGDMGTEDAIAYQVGSHCQTPMTVGGIAYTPSYGSQNPWWSMEDDWCRINLQLVTASGNTFTDSEWWNLTAHGDAKT